MIALFLKWESTRKITCPSNITYHLTVPARTCAHTHTHIYICTGCPFATVPSISLIILTPMKILQRNLNRSTFVVWEIKRNVSVVRFKFRCNILISGKIIKEMPGSVASGTHCTYVYRCLGEMVIQNCQHFIHGLNGKYTISKSLTAWYLRNRFIKSFSSRWGRKAIHVHKWAGWTTTIFSTQFSERKQWTPLPLESCWQLHMWVQLPVQLHWLCSDHNTFNLR